MDQIRKSHGGGRRGFLKALAVTASGLPGVQAQQAVANPGRAQEPTPETKPQAPAAPSSVQYPRTFTGRQLAMIAFPLGGVAAGGVALGGRGQLRDWQIFNRPD